MLPMLLVVAVEVTSRGSARTTLCLAGLVLLWHCSLSCADCRQMEEAEGGMCRGQRFASRGRVCVRAGALEGARTRTVIEGDREAARMCLVVDETEEVQVAQSRILSVAS
jgi:hypothetical protein